MKLIAKYNVQMRGHIYAKGEAMEWDGPLTPRIIANFSAADGRELSLSHPTTDGQDNPPQPTPGELPLDPPPETVDEDTLVKRTLAALKREGVMRQLDDMGVTYPPNAKNDFLARLLLSAKGEIQT